MDYNLIIQNFVNTSPFILEKDITSVSFKLKSNGEQVGIITTRYGTTYVKTITPDGLRTTSIIEIPVFYSRHERDTFIYNTLYRNQGYSQSDIALFLNMSQSQISNIIRNYSR